MAHVPLERQEGSLDSRQVWFVELGSHACQVFVESHDYHLLTLNYFVV